MSIGQILLAASALLGGASFAGVAGAAQQPDPMAAVNACLTKEQQARSIGEFSLQQRQAMITCLNAHTVRQMQSSLPIRVDNTTSLTQLTSDGPATIYHYRITHAAPALPADFASRIEAATRANVCGNEQMRATVGYGGAFEYRWSDNAGRPIHRMRVTSC